MHGTGETRCMASPRRLVTNLLLSHPNSISSLFRSNLTIKGRTPNPPDPHSPARSIAAMNGKRAADRALGQEELMMRRRMSPLEETEQKKQGTASPSTPCAACKLLRRRCAPECVFAPHFPAGQPQKFADVHKVYGASNVSKILQVVRSRSTKKLGNLASSETIVWDLTMNLSPLSAGNKRGAARWRGGQLGVRGEGTDQRSGVRLRRRHLLVAAPGRVPAGGARRRAGEGVPLAHEPRGSRARRRRPEPGSRRHRRRRK